ncbi:MAG TPA: phosphate-starvation-inducible PsiE family protein [Candidatus Angelobacter sp.]
MGERLRVLVGQGLAVVEDIVYAGLGVLLAIVAFALLAAALKDFATALSSWSLPGQIVGLLDQLLLILLIIELLYTVQVSFREHGLLVEPFLVVALIAVIRRILVLTAELPKLPEAGGVVFNHALIELALLTVMVLVLVAALIMFQKQTKQRQQDQS